MTTESYRKYGQILGIGLNSTSTGSVPAYVKYRIKKRERFFIVTPNPEIVLASTADEKLAASLKKADLALPDGIGLAQAARFLALPAPKNKILRFFVCLGQGLFVGAATFFRRDWLTDALNVLPGRKVFLDLVSLAEKNSWRVFLLGGYGGVAEKAAQKLSRKYKRVKFAFADGPKLNHDGGPVTKVDSLIQKRCLNKINEFKPQLLFVALGPTKQEKWLARNLAKLNVGGAMAVGGTFNYVAGVSKLPPEWLENLGLEWLWRLLNEPWRLGRILNAFPIFPLKVFWSKLTRE